MLKASAENGKICMSVRGSGAELENDLMVTIAALCNVFDEQFSGSADLLLRDIEQMILSGEIMKAAKGALYV